MTPTEWLAKVQRNRDDLASLVATWHPTSRAKRPQLPITARCPESACQFQRNEIRDADDGEHDPLTRFDLALERGDWGTVHSLLSDTWIGVPESTDCWRLRGFARCVDLLDEPPECESPNEA